MRTRTALLSLLALLLAACGNLGDSVANQVLSDQGITVDGDQVTIDTPDGTITAGQGLPAGFPDGFPLPEGAAPQGGVSGATGAGEIVAAFEVPGAVADHTAFYADALPAAGYVIDRELTGPDRTNAVFEITGNGFTGTVVLNPGVGDATQLAVTLDQAPR